MVRPHLEYSSVAWSPYYVKDKALLERVQHRFTRMFPELKDLPYSQRLAKLRLWSLEERRNRADLIEIFKMIKGFQQFHGHTFSPEMIQELPGVIIGSWWRRESEVICASIVSLTGQLIDGTVWHKRRWMLHLWIRSKTTWRSVESERWTSLWTKLVPKSYGCTRWRAKHEHITWKQDDQVQPHLVSMVSFFFRRLISELAERNSTKIGHMLGSNSKLKTHVQNLEYPIP